MKKVIAAVCSALLVVVLAFALTGCDKSGSIERAFKNAGYEVTSVKAEESSDLLKLLNDEQKKEISKYKVIACKKDASVATVIKFPSEDTLKEVLGETVYTKMEETGFINGNCYLITLDLLKALDIFRNA